MSYFATGGSSSQTLCPDKHYNFDVGQSSCSICPDGYFCNNGALYDCYTQGTDADNTDDDFNQFCIAGVVSKCSTDGTYNTHPNAQSAAFCTSCLEGYKCIFASARL